MSKTVKRLYEGFNPKHYDISIKISPDKKSFSGSMTMQGARRGKPSERITLHQKGLKITNAKIIKIEKGGEESEIKITRTNLQESSNEVRLHAASTVYSGNYTVSMDFNGQITSNMDGIYPCNFKDGDETKQLIATQFESHHAREAFPCIDEPEAKATFNLNLTHSKNEVALGNTPIESEVEDGDAKTTTFETTPIMSTYLLAFVTGELDYLEAKSSSGIKIRTYATKDQFKKTEFALDMAVKSMDFYEDYYDIPFPLQKCDFVALPDFASGAMENWGLITFREHIMLLDETTSLSTKQYIAIVVAHELTHQWFGNLVTMRWWTDLWLNEGFASWMEYLAIDSIFPEWNLWTQFAVDEQQLAMKADALENTHPIEVAVKHPDEIRTIFDIISYQKGASAIHMLSDYLGADGFRDGLRHYLKTHAYKNTDTVDLWQALEDVTKKPVKEFMHAWTAQSGFPILNVSTAEDHLEITQSKFVTNPESKSRSDKEVWPVPLLASGVDRDTIDKASSNVPFTSDAPIKINSGQTGFYRVNYSHEIQAKQIQAIKNSQLTDIDKMGLLADSLEITKAGYQPVDEFMDLLSVFKDEDSLPVWEIIAGSLGSIRAVLSDTNGDDQLRDALKPLIRSLVAKQLDRLGWDSVDGEPHLDALLRPIIVGLAASADEKSTVDKALKAYRNKIDNNVDTNPDIRGIVYCTAARLGGKAEYDELLAMYKNTTSSDEKLSITAAMTNFTQADLHTDMLALLKTDTVRLQDISYWLAYSLQNRHSRIATWEWMQDSWSWMKDNIGSDLSFSRTPIHAARTFTSSDLLKQYVEFFSGKMEPMLERSYAQGLEIAQTNAAWNKRDSQNIIDWLAKNPS